MSVKFLENKQKRGLGMDIVFDKCCDNGKCVSMKQGKTKIKFTYRCKEHKDCINPAIEIYTVVESKSGDKVMLKSSR